MRRLSILFLVLFGLVSAQEIWGQVKTEPDVVRVKTELVQTDVTVVDKRGRFVDGLTADDFELRVDAKLQPLSFFEEVISGSRDEGQQLTAARKRDAAAVVQLQRTSRSATDRGRVILIFVDDVHLAADSLDRAPALSYYIL